MRNRILRSNSRRVTKSIGTHVSDVVSGFEEQDALVDCEHSNVRVGLRLDGELYRLPRLSGGGRGLDIYLRKSAL